MNTRSLLILILFLIWGAGSTYWYVCKIKGFCPPKEIVTETKTNRLEQEKEPQKEVVKHGLIYYLWGKSNPVINDSLKWLAEVKSLKQLQTEGKKLKIEAPYYSNEPNPTDFDNLGLARAHNLKNLLSKEIDASSILTAGKLIDSNDRIPYINQEEGKIYWVTFNDFVKESDNKTLIYFPYNSTKEIRNAQISNYLDEVAKTMKNNPGYKLIIVGHTDNDGSEAANLNLGLRRAKRIKNVLVRKGVQNNRIIVESKGETEPIADNTTAKGRQENRRVEINFIKK